MNKVFSSIFVLFVSCFLVFFSSCLRALLMEEVDEPVVFEAPDRLNEKIDDHLDGGAHYVLNADHLNGEMHYLLSDEYREVIEKYDSDLSLAKTVSLMDQYHKGTLTFIRFYDNRKDSEQVGGGLHLILRKMGRYEEYFILSKFELIKPVKPYSHGHVHDTVKLYVGDPSELLDSDMIERWRAITYVINGAMNKAHIIDQHMMSKTYPGTESHGDSVEVLLPRGEWVINSRTYDGDGKPRYGRFDPGISSFLYKRSFFYDYVFQSFADYFRGSLLETLVTSRLVQIPVLSAMLSKPKISLAATCYLGKTLWVAGRSGGKMGAGFLHKVAVESGAAPAVMNAMTAVISLLSRQLIGMEHYSSRYLLKSLTRGG